MLNPVIVFVCAFGVFARTVSFDFVNWDDTDYIVENERIRKPSIGVEFTTPLVSFLPLRNLSFALDYKLWGLKPYGYHLHNVLLYAFGSVLVFFFLRGLIHSERGALFGALLFALHPIHTESVAWCSARKDVLSLCFFLGAFLLYIRYTSKERMLDYLLSILCFYCAMLSKGTTIVLPLLLILYDLCLRRAWWAKVLAEKLPYALLAGFVAYLSLEVGISQGAVKPALDPIITAFTVSTVYVAYLRELFFPLWLAPQYPTEVARSLISALPSVLSVMLYFAFAVLTARISRELSFALFWFPIALLPVSNIVAISTVKADRYLHIPSFMVAMVFGLIASKMRRQVRWLAPILVLFGGMSVWQSGQWSSSIALWSSALRRAPNSHIAHYNIAHEYFEKGKKRLAIRHWLRAGEILERRARIQHDRFKKLSSSGTFTPGRRARLLEHEYLRYASEAYFNAGTAFARLGDYAGAIRYHSRALHLHPSRAEYLIRLAVDFALKGDTEKVEELLNRGRMLKADAREEFQRMLKPELLDNSQR